MLKIDRTGDYGATVKIVDVRSGTEELAGVILPNPENDKLHFFERKNYRFLAVLPQETWQFIEDAIQDKYKEITDIELPDYDGNASAMKE